jgi:dTMP kinase
MVVRAGRGLFLTLEGGEGAGKSTQARALSHRLEAGGYRVITTREPGGTNLGEIIRGLLRRPAISRRFYSALTDSDVWTSMDPWAELFLFEAARAQLVNSLIEPALSSGSVVICDRFTDSTLAYQGYGRGLDLEAIAAANALATRDVRPDLTVLLDLPVEVGLARNRGEEENWRNSLGGETVAFYERVRAGFHALARAEPDRWLVLDATQPPDVTTNAIWVRLQQILPSEDRSTGTY